MLKKIHNPDVLTCLANLSSDEVFTPPKVANNILDMLPENIWKDDTVKFLDPVSKSGVFLREITKRLLVGLEPKISSFEKRLEHILNNQVYGIATSELTAQISRRTLYFSKKANNNLSIIRFKEESGNIKILDTSHDWDKNGKCKYCGVNKKVYDKGDEIESYAYSFIHVDKHEDIFDLNFDVIVGNPPYQMGDGSGATTDAAMPIYNKFIDTAIKLNPSFLTMIVPSKWMVGGRGLEKFRNKMFEEHRIRKIVDFEDASECFPGIHLDGGVCYFLWDKNYKGDIDYTFRGSDGHLSSKKRKLKNDLFEYVIRDNRTLSLLEKVSHGKRFSHIVSPTQPFGIRKYLFNDPERIPNSNLNLKKAFKDSVKIYGVKGIKGGAKRVEGYVSKKIITKNQDKVNQHKLFFTTSYSTNAVEPPKTIIGDPGEICTETFLMIGPFQNKEEQLNCLNYMNTKFFKSLLYFGKGTMQVTQSVFGLIPLCDFSKSWNDEKLYKQFNLSKKEIGYIESIFD